MIGIFVGPRRRTLKLAPSGQADSIPPVLSNLSIDQSLQRFSFMNNEVGACHWMLDSTVGFVNAAALIAAKSTAVASGSVAATLGAITHNIDSNGVAPGAWRLHVGVIDAAGNASNVLSGDFIIAAGVLAVNASPLVWNGDDLIFNAA